MPYLSSNAPAVQNTRRIRHRCDHETRHGMDPRVKPEDDEGAARIPVALPAKVG